MNSVAAEENVVVRVVNLPLVSSTCAMVSSAYSSTKENHLYLKSACEVAEKGVKSIAAAALTSAKPIIQKLEPQIGVSNNYAYFGLEKIEEMLSILCQPTDKIVANATDIVVSAKKAVMGVKDSVAYKITGVLDKTKGAVHGRIEMTKAVVSDGMNTVLGSHMVQMVSTGVDAALTKSEALVDQYFPLTEAKEATRADGFETETQKSSYYIRLGSLSSKIRRHAYEQTLTRIKDAKHRSQEVILKLHCTVDLMGYAHKNLSNANRKLNDAQERLYQSWISWKRSTEQKDGERSSSRQPIELCALTLAQDLSRQLQTNCLTLVASVQGLPQNIQNHAQYISYVAGDIYLNFHSVASFRDVSEQLLTSSKGQLNKIKGSLDEVMAYLASIPLNWLVGPVCPQPKHGGDQEEQADQQE
ncbi:perilipin-2 isoform X3 [Microcaecilia unicolor]|uniref:Perilipin n=1 Tax=Microcaecilia unicolor TaxID=1415580 RepID=A0A6P7X9R5_9AMPH|nr:perilipin-2-like isoform X3 [Microcaecilia unicolor]XP_030050052.1 perilipin-2-like isoform X3 [Microcaecilia unicolor]XP_030050053.1 perilipin-2-like isoform X3 [Microcaecilia unicolor]XP_030050054.1 perilipin-2-like isoform X3 [Microcaecilia unicolor]XP_030050055.1 perilipin-2-like isoform X3 [Microcaecilia unicolor]XP_030050056.1 perilipin-2-like isoform X3 [Microcaecilia unicolor]XP_030050057.1 perilipin-2-like isoform X3 [Microcaecilia unicolor]